MRLTARTLLRLIRLLWRYFVTGRPLSGRPTDNATWLHDATIDHRGGPVERLSRARWRRVARRWAGIGVPALLLAWDWRAAAVYAGAGACAGGTWAYFLVAAWWPQRTLRKIYIYPAARVLARVTGTRFKRRDALRGVVLPVGFGTGPVLQPVILFLPDVALDAGMRKRILAGVAPRLGLPGARAEWTEVGARTSVALLPAPAPPKSVEWTDLLPALRAAPLARPIVGVGETGEPVHTDFDNDSPHTLGSAGSGGGKSTFYKFLAIQRLAHGEGYAIFLDFKKWSHLRWAGRLEPGRVLILDEVPQIHAMLGRVLDELIWRKSFPLEREHELAQQPVIDVYVEEINTIMPLLVEYWKAEVARQKAEARTAMRWAKRDEDEEAIEAAEELLAAAMGLPTTSPAVQALRYGVNLGREFRIHFHFIGQSMSAKAAGGRDTRESFRTRMLARWDRKTWNMLADGIDFIACPSGAVGIWAHVHGSSVEIVRVPYVSDEQAVEYVRSGKRPTRPMFHTDPMPVWDELPELSAGSSASLRELADILPERPDGSRMSLDALRKASQRPGFPEPLAAVTAGKAAEYGIDEVLAWFAERGRLAIDAG